MKSTSTRKSSPKQASITDEPRSEYKFDYTKAGSNRFSGRRAKEQVVVVLDPDVARVFTEPEDVNAALRALLSAIPRRRT